VTERPVGLDPRLRALYLLGVAVGVFFLPTWHLCAAAAAIQVALWLGLGLGARPLARQLRKLALFLAVIVAAYALVGEDPARDRWTAISILGLEIDINITGAGLGLAMVLRIVTVVLASHVARAGDPRALAAGLARLGLPRSAALAIDAVLALLGGGGGGGGGGRGGGGGGGHGRGGGRRWREVEQGSQDSPEPETEEPRGRLARFGAALRRLAKGDVGVLVDRLDRHVARAERHIRGAAPFAADRAQVARDIAVVAGIALTMLGIKALKLPGLPFAPGHKGVLLIPLYIAAGLMTRSRAGATLTGLTMGTVAFLLGDGRYGVFEIAKHVAPGVLVDLLLPFMRTANRRGVVAWAAFGLVVALGRFATVTVIALAVQAPALVYALLVPGLVVHAVFGVLSGIVTAPLTRAIAERQRAGPDDRGPIEDERPGPTEDGPGPTGNDRPGPTDPT
jgi:hypothetical protein